MIYIPEIITVDQAIELGYTHCWQYPGSQMIPIVLANPKTQSLYIYERIITFQYNLDIQNWQQSNWTIEWRLIYELI